VSESIRVLDRVAKSRNRQPSEVEPVAATEPIGHPIFVQLLTDFRNSLLKQMTNDKLQIASDNKRQTAAGAQKKCQEPFPIPSGTDS
jgi:hypothetical protein